MFLMYKLYYLSKLTGKSSLYLDLPFKADDGRCGRTFVGYIEKSFRDRGLRCDVLQLSRGVSLVAVVKRQIIEGVQAVVKIIRQSQNTGKIPLQIFDRKAGADNVRFDGKNPFRTQFGAQLSDFRV